jgi:hypothetical protein
MGRNMLPVLPVPTKLKSIEDANDYIQKLYAVLSKWKLVLANTGFLGAEGNLTLSTNAPASSDGEEGDVWIKH